MSEASREDINALNLQIQGLALKLDVLNNTVTEIRQTQQVFMKEQGDINNKLNVQITELKVKAGAWGAIAGAVMIVGAILLRFLGG